MVPRFVACSVRMTVVALIATLVPSPDIAWSQDEPASSFKTVDLIFPGSRFQWTFEKGGSAELTIARVSGNTFVGYFRERRTFGHVLPTIDIARGKIVDAGFEFTSTGRQFEENIKKDRVDEYSVDAKKGFEISHIYQDTKSPTGKSSVVRGKSAELSSITNEQLQLELARHKRVLDTCDAQLKTTQEVVSNLRAVGENIKIIAIDAYGDDGTIGVEWSIQDHAIRRDKADYIVEQLSRLPVIREVRVSDNHLANFMVISRCPRIEYAGVFNYEGQGLELLAKNKVRVITLWNMMDSRASEQDVFESLSKFEELESIEIGYTSNANFESRLLTGKPIEKLAACKKLEKLSLTGAWQSGCLSGIDKCTSLKRVSLSASANASSYGGVSKLPMLESFSTIVRSASDVQGFSSTTLRRLYLGSSGLDCDSILDAIASCDFPNLEELTMHDYFFGNDLGIYKRLRSNTLSEDERKLYTSINLMSKINEQASDIGGLADRVVASVKPRTDVTSYYRRQALRQIVSDIDTVQVDLLRLASDIPNLIQHLAHKLDREGVLPKPTLKKTIEITFPYTKKFEDDNYASLFTEAEMKLLPVPPERKMGW